MNKLGYLLLIVSVDWSLRIMNYFETYIYNDWDYAKFLLIPVILDTLLGIYVAKRLGKFRWFALNKVLEKLVIYLTMLVLAHVMSTFTVSGKPVGIFNWAKMAIFSAIMVKEAYSILRNLAILDNKKVPLWLLKKFQYFDRTGKFFEDVDKKDNEKEEQDSNNQNKEKDDKKSEQRKEVP